MITFKMLELILGSADEPITKSSRRLLKVLSDGEMEGRYEPTAVGSHVSGILIWFNFKYFFLTARHCLQKFRDSTGNEIPLENFYNHSPYWINKSDSFSNSILDFLYVRKIWFIGEVFKLKVFETCEGVDLEDLCLLEIYYPMQPVKNYINLNNLNSVIRSKSELKNSLMGFSGYPAEKNPYFWEENDVVPITGTATHSTLFSRWHDYGINIEDSNCIQLFKTRKFDYTGMCGGTVFTINDSDVKWAGMYISGSDNKARYIPSYLILDVILNYRQSRSLIIDQDAEICGGANHVSNAEYRKAIQRMEKIFKNWI
ncbi:hypothetical protein [uncultured Acinetobacter sp.]|uniref:hypothetical protein n=1 Tax=uncultured Acinetobacter sp. TaxID=165433 RepID=UPI002634EA3D|nr:hypothetical protein [uncultured Acinetobacter sp.]